MSLSYYSITDTSHCLALPCLTSPCHALPCPTSSHITLPYITLPYHTLPYPASPSSPLHYHTLSSLVLPLQDYEAASQMYKLAKEDFKSDKSTTHLAHATLMAAICHLITGMCPLITTTLIQLFLEERERKYSYLSWDARLSLFNGSGVHVNSRTYR